MKKHLSLVMVFLLLFSFSQFVRVKAGSLPRALWTTNASGDAVNLNTYPNKEAVYISGGPQNESSIDTSADGLYYVQVTEPGGKILGSSYPNTIEIINGKFLYRLWDLTHFEDTLNPSGVYKVWISQDPGFDPSLSKTDNFKVKGETVEYSSITIQKFYDSDGDGTKDAGEPGIVGWNFKVIDDLGSSVVVTTGVNGEYTLRDLFPGTYTVEECASTDPNWKATTTTVRTVNLPAEENEPVVFGNLYLGKSNPRTLGFWSNKNGQALLDTYDFAALNSLNLALAKPFVSSKSIATWLLNATATDMKYMFRAQMATMKLNVVNTGFVPGSTYIWTGNNFSSINGLTEYMTVNELIAFANGMLDDYANTDTGLTWTRAQLEYVKNIFDNANNNGSLTGSVFVQPYDSSMVIPF